MAEAVYILCAATSCIAVALVARAYFGTRARLLLWVLLCFVGLALNNLLLIVDKLIAPDTDLSLVRSLPALVGVAVLALGLIWDERTS